MTNAQMVLNDLRQYYDGDVSDYEILEENGWSDYLGAGGIIFKDGSTIDCTNEQDHRTILSANEWIRWGVITYRVSDRQDAFLRIHGSITYRQMQQINELFSMFNIVIVIYDIYNVDDVLVDRGDCGVFEFKMKIRSYLI